MDDEDEDTRLLHSLSLLPAMPVPMQLSLLPLTSLRSLQMSAAAPATAAETAATALAVSATPTAVRKAFIVAGSTTAAEATSAAFFLVTVVTGIDADAGAALERRSIGTVL